MEVCRPLSLVCTIDFDVVSCLSQYLCYPESLDLRYLCHYNIFEFQHLCNVFKATCLLFADHNIMDKIRIGLRLGRKIELAFGHQNGVYFSFRSRLDSCLSPIDLAKSFHSSFKFYNYRRFICFLHPRFGSCLADIGISKSSFHCLTQNYF